MSVGRPRAIPLFPAQGADSRGLGCDRGRSRFADAGRIQIKLAHFVEQGFVADAQHLGGVFAAPAGLFQRIGYRFHFRFVLQSANQRFQALLAGQNGFLARRSALR